MFTPTLTANQFFSLNLQNKSTDHASIQSGEELEQSLGWMMVFLVGIAQPL